MRRSDLTLCLITDEVSPSLDEGITDMLHLKDYSNAARRFVSPGDGDIPIASLLAATLPAHQAPLTLTIETHAPSEPAATTRRSVHGVRQMIDGLGLT